MVCLGLSGASIWYSRARAGRVHRLTAFLWGIERDKSVYYLAGAAESHEDDNRRNRTVHHHYSSANSRTSTASWYGMIPSGEDSLGLSTTLSSDIFQPRLRTAVVQM
jgi:hypothetical protein